MSVSATMYSFHAAMKALWDELRTSAALAGDTSPAIARASGAAVAELGLEGRFAELERLLSHAYPDLSLDQAVLEAEAKVDRFQVYRMLRAGRLQGTARAVRLLECRLLLAGPKRARGSVVGGPVTAGYNPKRRRRVA